MKIKGTMWTWPLSTASQPDLANLTSSELFRGHDTPTSYLSVQVTATLSSNSSFPCKNTCTYFIFFGTRGRHRPHSFSSKA